MPPPVSTPWQIARYVRLISRRSSAAVNAVWLWQRARDEQQPARVLVEPVHEAGARQQRELGIAMQQRVLQRARAIAGAGVHDEADGLVDDEQRVVGVDDRERYRLGPRFDCGFELGLERELLAALQQHARFGFAASDRQRPGVDPGAQPAPRELRQQRGGRLIEAATGELGGDRQAFFDAAHGTCDLEAGNFRYTAPSNTAT